MQKFNAQIKEFCQLTIDLIDVRNEKAKFLENNVLLPNSNDFTNENELFEKTVTLIKKIKNEVEKEDINSNNINNVQRIYSFLSQFNGSNFLFDLAIKNKLKFLNHEIEKQNLNSEKINELKIEIDKINQNRMIVKNWWLDYSN